MDATVDECARGVKYSFVTKDEQLEAARQLFLEYAQSLDIDLSFQGFEAELESLPGKYSPPEGALILAAVQGESAGCVALRKLSSDVCEMKRLYVRDAFRGYGIGSKLMSLVIEQAKHLNYRFMRLDTLATMRSAQALYVSAGFYDIDPYVYNPIEGARFMELNLKG